VAGQSPHRGRPRNIYPRGAYRTRDGYIALNIPDERMWARFCETMGRPELAADPRTDSAHARIENREFLDPIIEGWLAGLTREEAVSQLNEAGVPAGPVQTAEDVFACPQAEARGALMEVHDPEFGDYRFARTPPHLSAVPDPPAQAAPNLGQHTAEVLAGLGYGGAEIEKLAADGVVQLAD
jgi:crotonobetainyl-CoA:carnitine CoA-transferase CaiB-like acyl-CoA transferase